MPALDFTAWPSKPAAPPAASAGAPKAGPKTGSSNAADGGFGQLVDRLSDADEGKASSTGVSTRGSRDAGAIGEEGAAEPRAKKGDAEGASGTANDAPAAVASMVSNPAPFPWTLPLSPSLWNIEQVQGDGAFAGETGEGEGEGDGDSVIGAAAAAITDSAAAASVATLPGAGVGTDAQTSTAFTIPVQTPAPTAVNPASTAMVEESTSSLPGSEGVKNGSAVDAVTTAWTGAAGAAGSVSTDAGANVTEAGGDPLANTYIAGAGQTGAAATGHPSDIVESAIGQSAATPLANTQFDRSSTGDPNDSALVAQSAIDAATMAAAVEDSSATTAAGQTGQTGQTNAAIDGNGPVGGDQAREQALIELQRALDAARANASTAPTKHAGNADGAGVIQTGITAAGATAPSEAADAAIAAANAAASDAAAANAGDPWASATAPTGEAAAGIGALASASTSRSRDAKQTSETSEELSGDDALTGASSWAAAAAAKYADAAGAGTFSGSDTRDSGSSADAVASLTVAGRVAGEAGGVTPIGFDARVLEASRTEMVAPEFPRGWADESGILTTAAPEEQAAQIVRSMRLQWRGATGEATLRLQPDHLGQVFVSVRVEQGTVSATVRAETPAAQQWIQQHQQQLRDALDAQGLRVGQFHVTSNPDDRPRRDHEQDQNQDASGRRFRPRARNNEGDERRFEIHL